MPEDKAVASMEADVRRMAGALRPTIASTNAPMPNVSDRVTVSHLQKALDQLREGVAGEAAIAWSIVEHMTGVTDNGAGQRAPSDAKGPVFERLATQITDIAAQLAVLKRAHETLQRALS